MAAIPDARTHLPAAILLGASGMLGRAMADALAARGWRVVAPPRAVLDLARPATIRSFDWPAAAGPWHIVNCAAWTDVDGAETREAEATAINADALAELATVRGPASTLLTFGTDYVFSGGRTPYPPDHPRRPLNAYGRSKAAGEEALESLGPGGWLNVRTSWLYAPWGRNFVRSMAELVRERPVVRVVDDQRGRPTSARHLAASSLALLERGATGHWHVCDGGDCTWYDLAAEVARLTQAQARVEPCATSEFPRPAIRPAYSVLGLAATEAALGPMPHWRRNLERDITGTPVPGRSDGSDR
jgi:dTDP-4-dehydrorhamnose reductase